MDTVCTPILLMSFWVLCLSRNVAGRHCSEHPNGTLQGLQKIYTPLPLCSTLKPDSITTDTICLSSCGNDVNDPGLVCNPQAETWKIRLQVDAKSTTMNSHDCPTGQQRFKCMAYESNEIQCADATFDAYPEGYSCFTRCGELKCPSGDFLPPSVTNDFKLADCQSSYRVRCRIHPNSEGQKIGIPDLTMELQIGGRGYHGHATG